MNRELVAPRSAGSRDEFLRHEAGPLAVTQWDDAIFLHYRVSPSLIRAHVPFPLDLFDAQAWVSVVMFSQRGTRPAAGGGALRWAALPIANYRFCNLRTYVCVDGEPGVYFLTEWLSNPLAAMLARVVYGLPCSVAQERYRHDRPGNVFTGLATAGERRFSCRSSVPYAQERKSSVPGSLDHFCLERYTAFTLRGKRRLRFRISHEPWPQISIDAQVEDDNLLTAAHPWLSAANPSHAHYSPGVADVWIGRPHRAL